MKSTLTQATALAGGPPNDRCPGAEAISVPDSVLGSTIGATFDAAPLCGTDNTSAGVWYLVIGTGNTMTATTCTDSTNYDSKISVYCGDCDILTCVTGNDDDCILANDLASTVQWCSESGSPYLILVHGFFEVGNFGLQVFDDGATCPEPARCDAQGCVSCGPNSTPEDEPDCGLPVDTVNGGCNSAPTVFSPITCGETICGTAGADATGRDTDWFEITITESTVFTWTVTAEFDALIGLAETGTPGSGDCADHTGILNPAAFPSACETARVTTDCLPPGTYWFFVAPIVDLPCGAEYEAALTCDPCGCDKAAPPGDDCWSTPCGSTQYDFALTPIPADFFGPGSDPFDGTVQLGGQTGFIDTVVSRLGGMCFDGREPVTQTVEIEIVELNLVSCEPITVTFNGGQRPEQWDVKVFLDGPQQRGLLTATKSNPGGGTFDTQLAVQAGFEFIGPSAQSHQLTNLPPQTLTSTGLPWSQDARGFTCGQGIFHPGFSKDSTNCCELSCHEGPAPGHEHCVLPPKCPECPQACCGVPGVPCTELPASECELLGGLPLGPGTDCVNSTCPQGPCEPTPDGSACQRTSCPDDTQRCEPKCVNFDPVTGITKVRSCACVGADECHVDIPQPAPGCNSLEAAAGAGGCVMPDVGGTVVLPPQGCPYLSPDEVHMIVDGLPPGTEIILDAIHDKFFLRDSGPGGTLGGEFETFDSFLFLEICGTGELGSFSRSIAVPVQCEVHIGPRTPGDAVQSFPTEMFQLQGGLFGDPDFDALVVVAGSGFGLPSPGHTTLTRLPGGNFAVDSFFDITYQIDFLGAPGSVLNALHGSTIGIVQMGAGLTPHCVGGCPAGEVCRELQTVNADGTIDICCTCEPVQIGACCDHAQPGGLCVSDVTESACLRELGFEQPEFFKNRTCAQVESEGLCREHTGACCDANTGICTDGVPESQCPRVDSQFRWDKGTLCADLDPPCQTRSEACCFEDGRCLDLPGDECRGADGAPRGPGSACQGDGDGNGIDDACEFDTKCQHCGPGPHWIDTCPAGHDRLPSGAVVGVDRDGDCIVDMNLVMFGPAEVARGAGSPHSIPTEMVAMKLTGGGVVLRAGYGGGIGPGAPLGPSLGSIIEDGGDPSLGDSSFDILFELDLGGGLFAYNQVPLSLTASIECVSPNRIYSHPRGCFPLFDSPIPGVGRFVANLVTADHDPFGDPLCPLPTFDPLLSCLQRQIFDCVGSDRELCLPRVFTNSPGGADRGGIAVAVLCDCFDDGGECGPVALSSDGGTLSCTGTCPVATQRCEIHIDGRSTGAPSIPVFDVGGGAEVTCECPLPPDPHVTLQGTSATFGAPDVPPIPADFFFPGSAPFNGTVNLVGGPTDTLGQRDGPIVCPGVLFPRPCDPVGVELVQLDLVSAAPIVVGPSQWDVAVDLSPSGSPPLGMISATLGHANGGTYNADIPFFPRFTFTEVGNPGNVRVLDYDLEGTPPIRINFLGVHWVIQLGAVLVGTIDAPNDGNFVPGVRENIPGDPNSQKVIQSLGLSKDGGIDHPVQPPSQTGACCDHAQPGGFCLSDVTESRCLRELGFEQPEFFKDRDCAQVEDQGLCREHTGACCDKSQPGGVCRSNVPESQCIPNGRSVPERPGDDGPSAGGGTCSGDATELMFPLDGTYALVDFFGDGCTGSGCAQGLDQHNDDDSATVPLGFVFDLYGDTYTTAFVNNNGNLSFDTLYSTFSPAGFPNTEFVMVAPFWGDVDTGDVNDDGGNHNTLGHVYRKFFGGNTLVVTWDNVGYYDEHGDLLNTFQVAISDGTNPAMGLGNNVCFSWDNMCWTTGDASDGVGGFGGFPAIVGANRGDGVEFFQIGAFDHAGIDYDGPFTNNDGVSYLDFSSICFSTAVISNIAPIPQGFPGTRKITVDAAAGEVLDLTVQFISPEEGQTVTVAIADPDGGQAGGLVITNNSPQVEIATIDLDWAPDCADTGSYALEFTATDNFNPPGVTVISLVINVVCETPPQIQWFKGEDCREDGGTVDCREHTGACCDGTTGICRDDVPESECSVGGAPGGIGICEGDELCSGPCPAAGACITDADCGAGGECLPDCLPSTCVCANNEWTCTDDCLGRCVVIADQHRWAKDTLCSDLDPRCTEHTGACCDGNTGECRNHVPESQCGPPAGTLKFEAIIDGAQANKCVGTGSAASGIGQFTLDTNTGVVSYNITYAGLGSPESASHVHSPAPECINAGVLYPLPLGSPKIGVANLSAAQMDRMINGLHYVNIHSAQWPGGEIRGQIVLVPDDSQFTWTKDTLCEDLDPRCTEHTGACCDHAQPGGFCVPDVPESRCLTGMGFEQPEFFKDLSCTQVQAEGLCFEHTGACCDKSQPGDTVCTSGVPESLCIRFEAGDGIFVFGNKDEFDSFMREHGKVLKGIETFEESNIPDGGIQPLRDPLVGNVPNISPASGLGFPQGLAEKNLIIQTNITPGPNPPHPNPSGDPTALHVVGQGFLGANSKAVGENLFLQGIRASLDLIFTEPNHTGIGFELSRFEKFEVAGWHITVYDKADVEIGKFDVPPVTTVPGKTFFGVWSPRTIGRINIFDQAREPAPDDVDNIQMWLGGEVEPNQWHKGEDCVDDGGTIDCRGPYIVHADGQPGETRPCSGYIDPRRETNNGIDLNQGLDQLTLVFSEPVFAPGGGMVGPGDFIVTQTGPPAVTPIFVAVVDATNNPQIKLRLNRFIKLREWTTVRAVVVNADGKMIENEGDLGPLLNEPDRWDGGFLPCNVNQDEKCNPLDVTRFRQYVNALLTPDCGVLEDYVDINRNGSINPLDLTALRQLVFGTGNATKAWAGEVMNNQRP
ncbi:MAG: nidogen-like domain-containing protein [Phycisphaerae bacterium]